MAKAVVPSSIVFEVLEKDNYEDWRATIQSYLEFKDLWDVVESNEQPPERNADEAKFKAWNKQNSEALHAIQISCGRHFLSKIREIREANKAWRTLQENFNLPTPRRMESTINPQQGDEENVDDEYKEAYMSLVDALSRRDISDAIELCKKNPGLLKERLPNYTPLLHQLIMQVGFLKKRHLFHYHEYEVVELLENLCKSGHFPKEALEMRDSLGRTPLAVAIDSRCNSLIDELYSYYKRFVTTTSVWTMEDGKYGATVITKCFQEGRFDFASKVLDEHPHLIFAKDVNGLSPMYVAARAPHLFDPDRFDPPIALSPFPHKFQKFAYYCIFAVISIISLWRPALRQLLRGHRQRLEVIDRLIAIRNAIRNSNMTSNILRDAFFEAIKCGNFNFIVMLINYDKKFLEEVNNMSKDIYMCAIEYRQPKVFSLIFWDKKDWIDRWNYANVEDKWKNNLLHMTATWRPPNALDRISKPSLLMTREAMWFEEVSDLAPELITKVNIDGEMPYELFKESHKDLMMEAEKGMKESAASWAIVGPLIITIMFAAAFQIPGGYNQEMGFPIFLNKTWFKFYMVLVSISLFSATISVLKFLEILSSDYHKKDFLSSLRTYVRTYNVITGTLFLSLATMLVAFCLGLFLTLHGERAIFLPIVVTATFLVGYIVSTKFSLLVESFASYKQKNSLFEKNIGDEVELIFEKLNQHVENQNTAVEDGTTTECGLHLPCCRSLEGPMIVIEGSSI